METITTIIAGHEYTIEYQRTPCNGFQIVRTACKGRWSLTTGDTGDAWLDSQLVKAVSEHLYAK